MLQFAYRTLAFISRGLYIFSVVYNQELLILDTIYVVNKDILQKNLWFIIKSGFKSRLDYNGACTVYTQSYHMMNLNTHTYNYSTGFMFEKNVKIREQKNRFELNFQISKLDYRFRINSNGFSSDTSFEHKIKAFLRHFFLKFRS